VKEGCGLLDRGYAEWAYDAENEATLWKLSNEWVGFNEE
jgi:hypothetical protein